uniref:hypothetical protein n=1 Tax=Nitrospira cf. moscoviensis SBR1015 TaxID=96242 RepID=UPI00117FDF1C|nr:hypothetical protein [Nitrospira cf. moscoviensis SBR1015]
MDVTAVVTDRDSCELLVDREVEDARHLSAGEGERICLGQIFDNVDAGVKEFHVLAGSQISPPRNITKSLRIVRHGHRPGRVDAKYRKE